MTRARDAPIATRTAISRAPHAGARQEQAGNVDAGDQQHEHHRAGQHQHARAHVADDLLVEGTS
jgi:hypothetical protein